jgi:two-component system, OmpR family, response regulator ResD
MNKLLRKRKPDTPLEESNEMNEAGHSRGSVLVVDDEPTIREVVANYMRRAGYRARSARDGSEALSLAERDRPDIVILDLLMPGMDGLEVMRRLRAVEHDELAIILLTAKGEAADRVTGLRLGADDYVCKPFSPAELVARVDAIRRRLDTSSNRDEPLAFDALEIDPSSRRVLVEGQEASLTHREFELLLFLARHPAQTFSRSQLMDAVWQYAFYTDTSTVTVHIRRLRAKIEADPSEPRFIETVWGVGYRFAA